MTLWLLSVALLLLQLSVLPAAANTDCHVVVFGPAANPTFNTYQTTAANNANIRTVLTALRSSNSGFTFTCTGPPGSIPRLQTVNAVNIAQPTQDRKELWLREPNGKMRNLTAFVGGCDYVVHQNAVIIVNYKV